MRPGRMMVHEGAHVRGHEVAREIELAEALRVRNLPRPQKREVAGKRYNRRGHDHRYDRVPAFSQQCSSHLPTAIHVGPHGTSRQSGH